MTEIEFVREAERKRLTAIPQSTNYEFMEQGLSPPSVKIGRYAVAWIRSELMAVNAARAVGRSDNEIRLLIKKLVAARANALDETAAA